MDSVKPPGRTSSSTAQPVAWSPPLCRRTRLHYSFRHLPSLVHPFLLSSGSFRLSDLHHVLPITARRWTTMPPLPALPPAGILAALTSAGGGSDLCVPLPYINQPAPTCFTRRCHGSGH